MDLTQGEFCQFNLRSRINLLNDKGLMLMNRKLPACPRAGIAAMGGRNEMHEIRLFLLYDFYVEAYYSYEQNKILKVEPLLNNDWMDVYLNY